MNIGMIGLGKLGFPVALSIERAGHTVVGFDPSAAVVDILKTRKLPYKEQGAQALLDVTKIQLKSVEDVVAKSDIIFVAVQTPHQPQYEGITRIPETRADFDYTYLKEAVRDICGALQKLELSRIVVIISTVLPGTVDREIRPLLNTYCRLCYNPFFIAMGTTIQDFENPEFVLLGGDDLEAQEEVKQLYGTIHNKPVFPTTIKNAELIKVAYNTFIGMKICYANTLMEICHKTGCDVDVVIDALCLATTRLISHRYLRGGMGDGGGCHPRDNIALSWLAQRLNLRFDFFSALMKGREQQTEWLADIVQEASQLTKLPVVLLGKAFKPETYLTVGSPAKLLATILQERGIKLVHFDPYVDVGKPPLEAPAVVFLSTQHDCFRDYRYANGSVIIDPFRYMPDVAWCVVVRLGEEKEI